MAGLCAAGVLRGGCEKPLSAADRTGHPAICAQLHEGTFGSFHRTHFVRLAWLFRFWAAGVLPESSLRTCARRNSQDCFANTIARKKRSSLVSLRGNETDTPVRPAILN